MNFETYGPLKVTLPNSSTAKYDRWRNEFWDDVSKKYGDKEGDLRSAIGCYVFCLRNGASIKPWYVGKTIAQGGFADEIFEVHKVEHYRYIKDNYHGVAEIFLFPLMTEGWRFSSARKSKIDAIDWLETTLISMACRRNPNLSNISETKMERGVWVNGLLGQNKPGRPYKEATIARRAFFGSKV